MCFDCMHLNNIMCTFEINHFKLWDIDDERWVGKEKGSHVKITIPVYVVCPKLKIYTP